MVTFAQAQERGERWVNGEVAEHLHRAVQVREFDLGFVVWAEPGNGSGSGGTGGARLVIARDSGDTTLWPGLPVDEVVARYEEEYGRHSAPAPAGGTAERLDLEATSFLLTPPEWLQEAADQMGIPDRRSAGAGSGPGRNPSPAPAAAASPWDAADTSSSGGGAAQAPPATVFAPPLAELGDRGEGGGQRPQTGPGAEDDGEARTEFLPQGSALPPTAVSPALGDGGGPVDGGPSAPAQGTDFPGGYGSSDSASGSGSASDEGAGSGSGPGGDVHHAATMLSGPGAGDIAEAATGRAAPGSMPSQPSRRGGPSVPPPPGAPGTPGARPGAGPGGGQGAPGGGYVPTQMVSAEEVEAQLRESGQNPAVPGAGDADSGTPGAGSGPGAGGSGPGSGGDVHHAATMLAAPGTPPPPPPPGAPGRPGAAGPGAPPPPPGVPGAPGGQSGSAQGPGAGSGPGGPGGDVHHAATMLSGPGVGPGAGVGAPPPPGPPPAYGFPPGAPAAPGAAVPGTPPPPGPPPAYGYPQQPSAQPTVGPGYMAVLSYRAPDGSEQQLIRRSAPGTPHPEWQILHELRAMNVPPQQVVELHTELESCELPGGYCARMIRESWPQVRVSHTAPYGRDHASRQQGMRHLLEHQGELHQVADGPARPAPNRVPLPPPQQIPPIPPIPLEGIGQELLQAFGPQGVFRFDQRAVSRQGVPDVVGQTLMWAGLPLEVGPFFWAQAQPDRPVPTLAELAQERGVQPGPDAGSYLVMGNDFGRQLCVQYGTAHIVAVPLEAAQDGQPAQPQFVSTGLPEFTRALAMLGRMWPLRFGLTQEQAGRWTVDFQMQLAALDPAALSSPENWWSVLLEQMWDGLF